MGSKIDTEVQFTKECRFDKAPQVPAASFGNADIETAAANSLIAANKLEHQPSPGISVFGEPTTGVVPLYIFNGAGDVKAFEAVMTGAPSTGNVTLDLLKTASTGSTGASILSATIAFTSASVGSQVYSGTLTSSDTTISAGQALMLKITTTGTTGQLGSGLRAQVNLWDDGTDG